MVLSQILKVASIVVKHRKAIYAVLTAQDRYISKSFRYGGYGKATSYGVRSGALIGSVAGAFINNAEESPGNGISKPFQKQPKTNKPYQTRRGYSRRSRSRGYFRQKSDNYCRRPNANKYGTSGNRFYR